MPGIIVGVVGSDHSRHAPGDQDLAEKARKLAQEETDCALEKIGPGSTMPLARLWSSRPKTPDKFLNRRQQP